MIHSYIKYLFQRKGPQYLHSPFVYNFYQEVIRGKWTLPELHKKYLKSLYQSDEAINVKDFGAGSKIFNEESPRPIKKIHKYSSIRSKKGKLLAQIVNHYNMKRVLELGTCLGAGSVYMQSGLQNEGNIVTIEGDPKLFSFTQKRLQDFGLKSIHSIRGTFDQAIPNLPKDQKYDLIFIDGHHDGPATMKYLTQLKPFVHDQTFIILDDINWSKSMQNMWDWVIQDEQFHVTIDLYSVGILLKKQGQEKQHFILKF